MFGYRMSSSEEEQLHLRHLFADAMERRAPVQVSFFKERSALVEDPVTGQVRKRKIPGQYVKVTRTVEPYGFGVAKNGARTVKVVDRTPEGLGSRPDYRSIRLDRIAVSRATGRALATRKLTLGYMSPTLLDNRPLHPTKGVLVARAAA
jgi:hypothetical protein